jgi:glycosyltransferase involved in cell wall biosynthesis
LNNRSVGVGPSKNLPVYPINILFIIGQLTHGGSERHVVDIATRLDRRRFASQVLCLRPGGPLAGELIQAGVDLVEQPVMDWPLPFWRVWREVAKSKPDVVCVYTYVDKLWGSLAAGLCSIPVVSAYRTVRRIWYEPILLRYTELLVANAHIMRQDFLDTYDFDSDRVHYLPNGVDLSLFSPGDRKQARGRFNIDAETPLTVMAARFESVKNHETALAAFARVVSARPDARLIVAGQGSRETWIRWQIRSLGIEDAVTMLSPVDNMADLYNAADIVLLSSLSEGLPRVLVEAGACERPCLTTDVGGCSEVVLDGETGYVVPAADPATLAKRWLELLNNPTKATAMGRLAGKHVRKHFSMERMVDCFQDLMEQFGHKRD